MKYKNHTLINLYFRTYLFQQVVGISELDFPHEIVLHVVSEVDAVFEVYPVCYHRGQLLEINWFLRHHVDC